MRQMVAFRMIERRIRLGALDCDWSQRVRCKRSKRWNRSLPTHLVPLKVDHFTRVPFRDRPDERAVRQTVWGAGALRPATSAGHPCCGCAELRRRPQPTAAHRRQRRRRATHRWPATPACSPCCAATLGTSNVRAADCLNACERSNVMVVSPSTEGRRRDGGPVPLGQLLDSDAVANIAAWVRAGGPGVTEAPDILELHTFRPSRRMRSASGTE
jgi:hypothetical protein